MDFVWCGGSECTWSTPQSDLLTRVPIEASIGCGVSVAAFGTGV